MEDEKDGYLVVWPKLVLGDVAYMPKFSVRHKGENTRLHILRR